MTQSEMDFFLYSLMLVCSVMAIFNAFKHRTRGWAAAFLSASFLVFGGLIYLYRTGASETLLETGTAFLFILLAADFVFRLANPPKRKGK